MNVEPAPQVEYLTRGQRLNAIPGDEINAGVWAAKQLAGQPVFRKKRKAGQASLPAGSSAPILTGVVQSGTAATSAQDGNDLTLGTVSVWTYLTESEVDVFDPGESYAADKPVRLPSPEPHDASGVLYSTGDLVLQAGNVHRANGTTSGAFNANAWTDLGTPGVKFAKATVPTGDYDPADWDDATGERFIDRTRTAIDLDNHFEGDAPVVGAVAKWQGGRLIGFTCGAQLGWQ